MVCGSDNANEIFNVRHWKKVCNFTRRSHFGHSITSPVIYPDVTDFALIYLQLVMAPQIYYRSIKINPKVLLQIWIISMPPIWVQRVDRWQMGLWSKHAKSPIILVIQSSNKLLFSQQNYYLFYQLLMWRENLQKTYPVVPVRFAVASNFSFSTRK